jgi:hypothetical protein
MLKRENDYLMKQTFDDKIYELVVLLSINRMEVVNSVRKHLENQGYTVSHSLDKYGISVEMLAKRDKDTFLIEAIGEDSGGGRGIVYALGKLVQRMTELGFWIHYSVAMPKSYYKLLKDFEVGGFQTLKLHLFLVNSLYMLIHLDPKEIVEMIQQLKAGQIVNPDLITDF